MNILYFSIHAGIHQNTSGQTSRQLPSQLVRATIRKTGYTWHRWSQWMRNWFQWISNEAHRIDPTRLPTRWPCEKLTWRFLFTFGKKKCITGLFLLSFIWSSLLLLETKYRKYISTFLSSIPSDEKLYTRYSRSKYTFQESSPLLALNYILSPPSVPSWVAQMVKSLPAMQETWVRSLSQEDPLEEGMASHSNILAWRIPWTEEAGGLHSMGMQRVGHDWTTNTFTSAVLSDGYSSLLTALHILFVAQELNSFPGQISSGKPSQRLRKGRDVAVT